MAARIVSVFVLSLALALPGAAPALTGLFELGALAPAPRQLYFSSRAEDVSGDGRVVVGTAIQGFEYSSREQAFRWEAGEMIGMADLVSNHERSIARAVSTDGRTVVGTLYTYRDADLPDGGFVWIGGELVGVLPDQPGGSHFSSGNGVSADGRVIAGGSPDAVASQAIRYRDGVATLLGDLRNASYAYDIDSSGEVVVGLRSSVPVRWDGDVSTPLPDPPEGSFGERPEKISSDGRVVVGRSRQSSGDVAIRWRRRSAELLGRLPGDTQSRALDTSGDGGVVVGYSWGEAEGYRAFIWDREGGIRPLQEELASVYGIDVAGWRLQKANGISDDGKVIVGEGINPDGRLRGWVAQLDDESVLACADGEDNDGDGTTDYPEDAGCSSPVDETEESSGVACDDGVDNDRDGEIDSADDGCLLARGRGEGDTCDDSLDNDGDGEIDWDGGPEEVEPDGDCAGDPHRQERRYYGFAASSEPAVATRPGGSEDRPPVLGLDPLPTHRAVLAGTQKLEVDGLCRHDADYEMTLEIDLDAGVFSAWDGFVSTFGELERQGRKGRKLVFRERPIPQQSRTDDIEEYVKRVCTVEDDSVAFALTKQKLVGKINGKGTRVRVKGKYLFAVEGNAEPGMRDGMFKFSLGKARVAPIPAP